MNPLHINPAAYTRPVAAMVQPARNCVWYKTQFQAMRERHGKEAIALMEEFLSSGVWKEEFKTKAEACRETFDLAINHFYELRAKFDESDSKTVQVRTVSEGADVESNEKCLSHIEKAREAAPPGKPQSNGKPVTAEQWEKEHYDVKVKSNGSTPRKAPTESGKPKHALAIWKEIEESLLGRAINRTDELNRQCPNAKLHAKLLAQEKACLVTLSEWRESLR